METHTVALLSSLTHVASLDLCSACVLFITGRMRQNLHPNHVAPIVRLPHDDKSVHQLYEDFVSQEHQVEASKRQKKKCSDEGKIKSSQLKMLYL